MRRNGAEHIIRAAVRASDARRCATVISEHPSFSLSSRCDKERHDNARARVVVEGPVDWRVDKSGGGGACFGGEPQ
tara:strand:+ start:6199 stop:6426 length:228 start_codon:yes stop_codon:yes gene_type:complete